MLERRIGAVGSEKVRIEDLALVGGTPAFTEKQHVGRPNIGNREAILSRIGEMLDRRWLSNDGPFVRDFESRVADACQVKHCIVMCNATVALEITIRALGLTGEVIVPSFTFVATAHALQWQEITPVFADIDPDTHSLDPVQVERMITPRTSGIIGVHLWGNGCDIEGLSDVAQRHNLKLMFDAAHAFGCTHGGKPIGSFGNAEVFSFHATKFLNAFEGGAVVTNDDELARRIRLMRNFGFANYDSVVYVGTNGKMPESSAAMGLTSLESMDEFVSINMRNYDLYRQELREVHGVRLYQYNDKEKSNYQYVVLEIDSDEFGITRDQLTRVLHAENILARRYFFPGCHRMEPYQSHFPHAGLMLPHTDQVASRVLSVPTGTATSPEDIKRICQVIRFVQANGAELRGKV